MTVVVSVVRKLSMNEESECEVPRTVAATLRQATELLLQAAERLDPVSGLSQVAHAGNSAATSSCERQSRSSTRTTLRESVRNSNFCRPYSRSPTSSSHFADSPACASQSAVFQPTPLRYRSKLGKKKKDSFSGGKRWQHAFVCLALVGQYIPPDTADRVRLVQAGLGEKRVRCELESSAEELHETLMCTFPRLRSGGGYEFLKLEEASRRQLAVVPPPPGGYIPLYVKAIFLQAKVFIRPLQNDLDLTPLTVERVSA